MVLGKYVICRSECHGIKIRISSFFAQRFQDCQASVIEESLDIGIESASFRYLISWLTTELSVLLNLDEQVMHTI